MNIQKTVINAIRSLSVDAVQKANSGHPGMALGSAPILFTLWDKHLKIDRFDTKWMNRDRFVLSAGHASSLLYSLLHLYSDTMSIQDLKEFRMWKSKTPGHPEFGHTLGVDVTTGPLGAGIATAVGLAIAQTHLAEKYNKENYEIFNNYTYVLVGDGCLMEGISSEAASLAGTLELGNLIVLYDSNQITIEGSTTLAFCENVRKRFESYGFETFLVEDGNDVEAIDQAITKSKLNKCKPSFIELKTKIGYGSTFEGTAMAHGTPLGEDNVVKLKEKLQYPDETTFYVPRIVYEYCELAKKTKHEIYLNWVRMFENYKMDYPDLYIDLLNNQKGIECDYFFEDPELFEFNERMMSTRVASGVILNKIGEKHTNLIGGSADLSPSTMTEIRESTSYSKSNRSGRNIHFGIRENAMAAIGNGLSLYGSLIPYVSTFLVFSDYMKPMIRLSSLMKQPLIYIFTHDSIGVGEDGPTHQPIEQLTMLRAQPNIYTFRPADANETVYGWKVALTKRQVPTALILSRQNLPILEETNENALKGGYIIKNAINPKLRIISSGSEVYLSLKVAEQLEILNVRTQVISMPCIELFEEQSSEYQESVMSDKVINCVVIEAGSSLSWGKYIGSHGLAITLDHFGASASGEKLFDEYGFSCQKVVDRILNHQFKSSIK